LGHETADLSTPLRCGRDDKSVRTDKFHDLGWASGPKTPPVEMTTSLDD
jgi:hypothetical protein